jgi:hypothetical protein
VRCKYLRKGFKGMYVIQRTKMQGGMGRFADAPIKNDYSHVHDANQYGCVDEKRGDNDNDEDGGVKHPGPKSAALGPPRGQGRELLQRDGGKKMKAIGSVIGRRSSCSG